METIEDQSEEYFGKNGKRIKRFGVGNAAIEAWDAGQ